MQRLCLWWLKRSRTPAFRLLFPEGNLSTGLMTYSFAVYIRDKMLGGTVVLVLK